MLHSYNLAGARSTASGSAQAASPISNKICIQRAKSEAHSGGILSSCDKSIVGKLSSVLIVLVALHTRLRQIDRKTATLLIPLQAERTVFRIQENRIIECCALFEVTVQD